MMQMLRSGSTALLVELDGLEEVLALYAALAANPPAGVIDLVPAARTILVLTDPAVTDLDTVQRMVRETRPTPFERTTGEQVEVPMTYGGEDLDEVASLLGCTPAELVRRHSGEDWTVAFCGFSPGFGYLVAAGGGWDVPRRDTPRTRVPAGSVALAGEFSGIYPRASPGGWQLIGRTELAVFDLEREPVALLRPGTPVRFVDASGS